MKYASTGCVMCGKFVSSHSALIPMKCLISNGKLKAHRICKTCWFDKFAIEDGDHNCPGCKVVK